MLWGAQQRGQQHSSSPTLFLCSWHLLPALAGLFLPSFEHILMPGWLRSVVCMLQSWIWYACNGWMDNKWIMPMPHCAFLCPSGCWSTRAKLHFWWIQNCSMNMERDQGFSPNQAFLQTWNEELGPEDEASTAVQDCVFSLLQGSAYSCLCEM